MLVGHLPPLLSFSACKSSLPRFPPDRSHLLSSFRIAIWDCKRVVSFLALGLWLVGLALNIYGTLCTLHLYMHLMFSFTVPIPRRFDSGAAFAQVISGSWTHKRHNSKMEVTYNAGLDACVVSHFHRSLASPVGMLMVDVVLLASMLTGLLRRPHRSSTGIWHFLYQQVVPCPLSCAVC
jgi:hypothetical protein